MMAGINNLNWLPTGLRGAGHGVADGWVMVLI